MNSMSSKITLFKISPRWCQVQQSLARRRTGPRLFWMENLLFLQSACLRTMWRPTSKMIGSGTTRLKFCIIDDEKLTCCPLSSVTCWNMGRLSMQKPSPGDLEKCLILCSCWSMLKWKPGEPRFLPSAYAEEGLCAAVVCGEQPTVLWSTEMERWHEFYDLSTNSWESGKEDRSIRSYFVTKKGLSYVTTYNLSL